MSPLPRVSAVIPVFNGAAFLPDALASVRAQGRDDVEILVVDDGSTDGSADVAESLGARCLRTPNGGPAAARNRGVEAARADVIAFLDVDDLWPERKLDLQLAALDADTSLDAVVGHTRILKLAEEGERRYEPFSVPWVSPIVGSFLYRRRIFERVGGFDESLRQSEDVDWLLRAREAGASIATVEEVTYLYRIHERNTSRDAARRDLHLLRAVKKSLDRRRASR